MIAADLPDQALADAARRLREQGFRCSPIAPYWLPPATAAAVLLRSVSRLKQWRSEGKGPTPHRFEGGVQYRLDEVLAFRADNTHAEW